jgi:FtsP/CotA-like multicopper oxidase with cupredoxin domain
VSEKKLTLNRRQFLKAGLLAGAGLFVPSGWSGGRVSARNTRGGSAPSGHILSDPAEPGLGLSDPALQDMFVELAPNALDPGFKYVPTSGVSSYTVAVGATATQTGLNGGVWTPIFGYGQDGVYTWPGKTFEVQSGSNVRVLWENKLVNAAGQPLPHLLPVDTSLHWAYSLPGYEGYTIENDGVPIVAHVHGGHTLAKYDGNPEYFFSPGWKVRGPYWKGKTFVYLNDQPAGTVWYHDHALGITRLNVYAGMAGFYIIRDEFDTGLPGNSLGLPAFPYELAYAIQDRMFKETGELFYPAYPGDPFWDDFITDEDVDVCPDDPPYDGLCVTPPSALAEFFGDHMVVNGKIWPKVEVEPRNYRMRLLNGCDSRFLAIQFFEVPAGATDFTVATGPLSFTVIGSDQGLASSQTDVDTLLMETGSRYDVIFDFKTVTPGSRVIMKNIGGDEPFGGTLVTEDPALQVFGETDRIMAFDVVLPLSQVPDVSPTGINFGPSVPTSTRLRKVALFEGKDEFGRLQPLLGTAEPAADFMGKPINWPDKPAYVNAGLVGQMEGSMAWHSPTTENPALNSTEEWEIYNVTGDAHPVHLHLVHFEVLGRQQIKWDSNADEDGFIPDGDVPSGDGTYLVTQSVVQHNGLLGQGFRIVNPTAGPAVPQPSEYVENAPKDMVTALPGQITRIRATFDKPGRYVWHCHILSHEDHEMMRVLHVGGGA